MRLLCCLLAIVALAALAACAPRPLPGSAQASVIRSYRLPTTVVDPEPAWNPEGDRLVVRSANGFAVLEEGQRPVYLVAEDRRTTGAPQWLTADRVVFGPGANAVRTPDGRIVPTSEGLTAVTVGPKGVVEKFTLAPAGYRPRVGPDVVYAQVADQIQVVARGGGTEVFAPGFFAEPQRAGKGVAWQTLPVIEEDWWTGSKGHGALVIRWRPGSVDTLPGLVVPRWTAAGGVVATRLTAPLPAGAGRLDWFLRTGTEVVHVAEPGSAPAVVVPGGHSAAPHPRLPLVAAIDRDGALVLADLPAGTPRRIAAGARAPLWNRDGTRLLYEEQGADPKEPPTLVVMVLAWAEPPAAK
jgi:hypothetical protein